MQTTFAILTPLPVEYAAVCAILQNRSDAPESTLPSTAGTIGVHRVVCVLTGKGESNTAAAVQFVSQTWKPRWILLVGIAGGLAGLQTGDVIVSSYVYYLDFGKLIDGKYIRRPEYDFQPDRSLLAHAELIIETADGIWQDRIRVDRPDKKARVRTHAVVGYIGSGDKVIDDPDHPFFECVRATIPELHAVEMEASGAGAGLRLEQSRRAIGLLMIRGISDVPTSKPERRRGSDQRRLWKKYSSAAASAFVEALLLHLPADPLEVRQQGTPDPVGDKPDRDRAAGGPSGNDLRPTKAQAGSLEEPQGAIGTEQYARVLLPLQAERLFIATDRKPGDSPELYFGHSGLLYIAEEFVSLGCLQVVVPYQTAFGKLVESLPASFKDRVTCVDKEGIIRRRVKSLFEPIAEELHLPAADFDPKLIFLPAQGTSLIKEKDPAKKDRIALLSRTYEGTYCILLALHYELQLDINIGALAKSATELRAGLRNPASRANLAAITGVLRTYEAFTIRSFEIASRRRHGPVDVLDYLARNDTFRRLSQQAYLLGVPARADDAMTRVGELSTEIVRGTTAFDLVPRSRNVQASLGISNPSDELQHEVYTKGFVPPVVPVKGLVWKAFNSWSLGLPKDQHGLMLGVEGIAPYLPEMPIWEITEISDNRLRFGIKPSEFIEDASDFDLFVTKLLEDAARCPEHHGSSQVNLRRLPNGETAVVYDFCCRRQAEKQLKSWETAPKNIGRKSVG